MHVTATAKGYYGRIREPGDEFELKAAGDFSKAWMAPADKAAEKQAAKATGGKKASGAVGGGKKRQQAAKSDADKPATEQPQGTSAPKAAEGGTGDPYADGFDA